MTEEPTGEDEAPEDQPDEGESWTNPFVAEFAERRAAVEAMAGFQLKVDLEALERAAHVMYKNAEELGRHAARFVQSRSRVGEISDDYERELVRYLHNYLTSIYSLIEAQRVVIRHCWGERSEFETGPYTEHRKATFETGEAEFMTELRNYCTHRSIPLPGISTTFSWVQGGPAFIVNKLTLDREKLLKWKGWTAPAKAYLRAKEENFDLAPVMDSYVNAATRFTKWVFDEINTRNADARDEYLRAAIELKGWYQQETGLTDEFVHGPSPGRGGNGGQGNRAQRRGQRKQPKRTTKRQRKK
jgi:hypothetical protein